MDNYFHSSSLLGGLVCLILIIGIAVIIFKRWSAPYTAASGILNSLKGLRGGDAPAPARAPATSKGGMTLLSAIVILILAGVGYWYTRTHWSEWFPNVVQCGVMNETRQNCVLKPGEVGKIDIPESPDPSSKICMVFENNTRKLWYTTTSNEEKQEYSTDNPPEYVTSYSFKAGAKGEEVTFFFTKKPCQGPSR